MDSYSDLANRREVYIQRYASHLRNEYLTTGLGAIYKATRAVIIDSEYIDSIAQRTRLNKAIKEAVEPISDEMWLSTTGELQDLAAQESSYYAKMFGQVNAVAMSIPAAQKVISYADKAKLDLDGKSGVWTYFVNRNKSSIIKQIQAQINSGYRNNETVFQMAKRVKRVTDGLLNHQAESLVRTGASHYSALAREAMMNDNRDIADRKIFSAFFDNRTTLTCRGFDGNIYDLDDPTAPVLPLHFNERSIYQYLVKGQDKIDGTKASVGGKKGGAAEESYENREKRLNNKRNNPDYDGTVKSKVTRASNKDKAFKAEQIDADDKMDAWLRSNPRWFIDSSLGKKRAQLFIDGKVKLKGFTDLIGRPLRLDELDV